VQINYIGYLISGVAQHLAPFRNCITGLALVIGVAESGHHLRKEAGGAGIALTGCLRCLNSPVGVNMFLQNLTFPSLVR
jgi:hypothetical protein